MFNLKVMSNYDVAKNLMKIIMAESYTGADKIRNVSSHNSANYVRRTAEFCDRFIKEASEKVVK